MDKASEAVLALKPVTFRYKEELDSDGIPQFGLVAEEVEKVNPDLVGRDEDGKVNPVRYEAVNAMLLNEFLNEPDRANAFSLENFPAALLFPTRIAWRTDPNDSCAHGYRQFEITMKTVLE